MRRFDYDDNEDHREGVDNFFDGDEDPELRAMIESEAMQFQVATRDLGDRFLFRVVRSLEKSFFWRFYSLETRLRMVEEAYRRLAKLRDEE